MGLRRAAIYGGTFDPVHNGHIEVARRVSRLFDLDEVIFVPACVPPHKRNANITSAFHRFGMLALATEDDGTFRVSTVELDAPERPYAVDTVGRMQHEAERLFFIIGADSWSEIATWHDWQRLLRMCDLIVATRPGYDVSAEVPFAADIVDLRGTQGASNVLSDDNQKHVFITDAAMVDVSATQIRAAARSNDVAALRRMLPPSVAKYIEKYELYKN